MKSSILWKLMLLFCALAGCLAGYGILKLAGPDETKLNMDTKENTLTGETRDGVFFDESPIAFVTQLPTVTPLVVPTPSLTKIPEMMHEEKVPVLIPKVATATPVPTRKVTETPVPTKTVVPKQPAKDSEKPVSLLDVISSGQSVEWDKVAASLSATPTPLPVTPTPVPVPTASYPAKVFGQVPVVNPTDAYVTYFEFAWDLMEMMRPVIKERKLKEGALLTEFVLKALWYGVDVYGLDINKAITRSEAAMVLWIGAQLLDEAGTDTSHKTVTSYVTDLGKCSKAEKKATAYLFEQGFVNGYRVTGQKFYPAQKLKTEDGLRWLKVAKQLWK